MSEVMEEKTEVVATEEKVAPKRLKKLLEKKFALSVKKKLNILIIKMLINYVVT